MSTATLAGHRVTHARAQIPAWGIAWATVGLDEEVELAGAVELVIADLSFKGTIMSGGIGPKGRSSFRLAAGAGGWGKRIDAKGYGNDAGVKASTILADAASACGEALELATVPDLRPGPGFARAKDQAARVLEQLFPSGWYVGEDGKTRIGKRPPAPLAVAADIVKVDRALRTVDFAADSIASIVPGVVVEGIEAVDVMHSLAPGALRSTIWGAGIAPTDRTLAALGRLLEQLDPSRRFRGIYEYRVVTQTGERYDLQPIRVSIGMPDLPRVPVRPGIAGARSDLELGASVLVAFVDANPARPIVVGHEDADAELFLPTNSELDANDFLDIGPNVTLTRLGSRTATLGVARQTDAVICGPFAGTITGPCSTKVRSG